MQAESCCNPPFAGIVEAERVSQVDTVYKGNNCGRQAHQLTRWTAVDGRGLDVTDCVNFRVESSASYYNRVPAGRTEMD